MTTDVGASTVFAEAVGERLIYADVPRQWFASNNHVYEPVTPDRVTGLGVEFVTEVAGQANSVVHLTQMKSLFSATRIRSMIDLAKPKLWVDHSEFDEDPWLSGCQNGVLSLRDRQLIAPESVVTRRLGTKFDPEATCPAFERFLWQIFDGDCEKIEFLQRAVGYSLTGRTSEQCLFVLTGTGANGKSTFLKVLYQLNGGYAGSIPMHTLMQSRFGNERTDDLAALKGTRFVSAQEGEAGERLAESKIKLMTGGDPISCRRLYGAYETYQPQLSCGWPRTICPK